MDHVESLILFLSCLSFLSDLIMSGSVFHSILPLNLSEFNALFTVLLLGSWTSSFFLRLKFVGLRSKRSHRKEGFFEVKHL